MNRVIRIKNKIQGILRNREGFTLTELLIAVLIMTLATAALTSVIILAFRHFYKTIQRTEAQFLCASIAEFVEDELAFSNVSISDSGDVTWSNGTHNMGSNISFYVKPDGGSYTKVGESSIGTYGRIAISGDNFKDNYFLVASDGLYDVGAQNGYSLLAGMSLKWDGSKYVVEICVVDKDDKSVLSDEKFTVKPAVINR